MQLCAAAGLRSLLPLVPGRPQLALALCATHATGISTVQHSSLVLVSVSVHQIGDYQTVCSAGLIFIPLQRQAAAAAAYVSPLPACHSLHFCQLEAEPFMFLQGCQLLSGEPAQIGAVSDGVQLDDRNGCCRQLMHRTKLAEVAGSG